MRLAFSLLLLLGPACTDDGPREGTALDLGAQALDELPASDGEFLVWNTLFLHNTSSETIVLRRIEPIDVDGSDLVEILGIEIQRRGNPPLGGGFHKTYPPTEYYAGKDVCAVASLSPVAGHELEPGAERRVTVALEVVDAPGDFRVRRWRIHYRDEEGDAYQDSPLGMGLRIKDGGRPRTTFAHDRPCLEETQLLRDAVANGSYPAN